MEDGGGKLKFEYSVDDVRILELERKIKLEIRKHSLNVPLNNDIERYSDRYFIGLPSTESSVRKMVDIELMSPELIKALGAKREKKIEDIREIESSTEREEEESEEDKESEEIDDDYVENFYDEEVLSVMDVLDCLWIHPHRTETLCS